MADLLKNTTKQTIETPGGFVIEPGKRVTVPAWVLAHPYTQNRLRNGRLEIVVNAKGGKKKRDEAPAEAPPEE